MPDGWADWLSWTEINTVLRVFTVGWAFALGASVGSFLNVVVYRMPAGLSLSKPKSRCPACETQLRWKDNLPVLGWLLLRGRCRYCGVRIAGRYPLVETACGLFAAALAVLVVLGNTPTFPEAFPPGPRPSSRGLDPGRVALVTVLFAGQVVLLGMALIDRDGHRVPWRLPAFGLVLCLLAAAAWPGTRVDPAWVPMPPPGPTTHRWTLDREPPGYTGTSGLEPSWNVWAPADALTAAAGLAALGGLAGTWIGGRSRRNLPLVGAVAGAAWGLPAAGAAVGLGAAAGAGLARWSPRAWGPAAGAGLAATLVPFAWRPVSEVWIALGVPGWVGGTVAAAVGLEVAAAAAPRGEPVGEAAGSPPDPPDAAEPAGDAGGSGVG